MRTIPATVLVLYVALAFGTVLAAPKTEEPIIVTATRLPTPLERTSSTVAVITAGEIERKQYRTVVEALNALPSLSVVRNGGPGKLTSVFSRGTNANHTLVLIDGIEMNDPSSTDGRIDFSHILIQDVERIEVLHGPQGTLYGSDTIGAVVNIITKRSEGARALSGTVEGGSFDMDYEAGRLEGGAGKLRYSMNVQRLTTDGVSALSERFRQPDGTLDEDGHRNLTLSMRLDLALPGGATLDLSARHARTENDLDLNVFPVRDDSDSAGEDNRTYGAVSLEFDLLDGRTSHRLGLTHTRVDRETRDDPDPVNALDFVRESHLGTKTKLELQNDIYLNASHTLVVGLETEREKAESSHRSTSAFGSFSQLLDADARTTALYVQERFDLGPRLFGAAGVRLDDHDRFGRETTYRAAGTYVLPGEQTRVRGVYATGFKAPSLYQLFGTSVSAFGAFQGNPDLHPETSRGWELGLEHTLADRIRLGATYYENDVDDLIVFTPDFSSNENRDEVETWGAEAFLNAELSPDLSLGLSYTYARARDAEDDQDLLRRPRRKASLELRHRPHRTVTLALESIYVGPRLDTDPVSFARTENPEYRTFRLAGQWRFHPNWELTGRIENLFDEDYEEPLGFGQPGRGVFVGLKGAL